MVCGDTDNSQLQTEVANVASTCIYVDVSNWELACKANSCVQLADVSAFAC